MPMAVASRKGISSVAAESQLHRVLLTVHGRVVGVVDSADRLDEDLRTLRVAAHEAVNLAADIGLENVPARFSLAEVCGKLGIDEERVHARAREMDDQRR